MTWLDSVTNSTELEQNLGDSGGWRSLACCVVHGVAELDMT